MKRIQFHRRLHCLESRPSFCVDATLEPSTALSSC